MIQKKKTHNILNLFIQKVDPPHKDKGSPLFYKINNKQIFRLRHYTCLTME